MSFSLPSTRLRPSLRGANTSLYQESRRSAVRTIPAEVVVRAKAFNDESLQSTSVQSTSASRQIVAQQSKGPSPIVMERFQGVASQLMNQRIIRLGGAVDDDSCNLIVAQLLWLDATDPKKDITLYVNSPGGSVTAGMAVFDTMRHPRCPRFFSLISTHFYNGCSLYIGAFLLASGQQGKRFSLPNSRIMIHQPLGGAQGQAADIEIQANEIMHHKSTLNGYLAEFTGKPLDTVMQDTDRDFFMSAFEAKEYGLIDSVIEHPTDVAVRSSGIPMYAGEL